MSASNPSIFYKVVAAPAFREKNLAFRMTVTLAALFLAGVFSLPSDAAPLRPMPTAGAPCIPVNGLSFVCGPRQAEDLIPVPGTRKHS